MRILFLAMVLLSIVGCSRPPQAFSPSEWRTTEPIQRTGMARDFLANHYQEGMTVEEVKAQLGEPDFALKNGGLNYHIGNAVVDYRVLTFHVDEDGKTHDPKIWQTS